MRIGERGALGMNRDDRVLGCLDEKEVIEVASALVRIPSLTAREGMGMNDFYQAWFADLGIPTRAFPNGKGTANFFADLGAVEGAGRFMVNGHQDTKPVDGMTIEPFSGDVKDGRLHGRGSADMKGGIAAVLCALKAMVKAGVKPAGGITFFSDIEEEYGGGGGFYHAIEQGWLHGFAGLLSCEPSELELHIGNRGCFITAFEVRGKAAHSGMADRGVNAVHHAAQFIVEFMRLPYLQVENPIFGKSTLNFENIEGGLYLSAVPDRCVVCLDSRIIPETPPEVVQGQVKELIERLGRGMGMEIREIEPPRTWRPSGLKLKAEMISERHPLVGLMRDAICRGIGASGSVRGCPGMTIAMAAIKEGLPSVVCGPGSMLQAHTADEWVATDQIVKAARIYAAFMSQL
jgi:acetylornithine deacetylase/succinyl-diaminopimelate desuccinylase-like protein